MLSGVGIIETGRTAHEAAFSVEHTLTQLDLAGKKKHWRVFKTGDNGNVMLP